VAESGVELYELKPIDGKRPRQRIAGTTAPAHASLHSKVYVIDRNKTVVGSFNFDPRSINLNTEIALVIYSPDIAAQVVRMFDESTSPKSSYRVIAVKKENGSKLKWFGEEKGVMKSFGSDPHPGFWRRIQERFMRLVPEEQL